MTQVCDRCFKVVDRRCQSSEAQAQCRHPREPAGHNRPKTMRDRFAVALLKRGERYVTDTAVTRYQVLTRKEGGFYFIGDGGALRHGKNSTTSVPVHDGIKRVLLAEAVT